MELIFKHKHKREGRSAEAVVQFTTLIDCASFHWTQYGVVNSYPVLKAFTGSSY